ncbi:MAG: hypothetical protein RL274_2858 [Pseudomonadota bacterium]
MRQLDIWCLSEAILAWHWGGTYDLAMFARLFTRKFAALVVALGMLLGAMAPSLAAPAISGGMAMMPGMAMSADCMEAMDQGAPAKDMPRKMNDGACGLCTACALPVLLQQTSLAELLSRSGRAAFMRDVDRSSIAVLPALPPPIA